MGRRSCACAGGTVGIDGTVTALCDGPVGVGARGMLANAGGIAAADGGAMGAPTGRTGGAADRGAAMGWGGGALGPEGGPRAVELRPTGLHSLERRSGLVAAARAPEPSGERQCWSRRSDP